MKDQDPEIAKKVDPSQAGPGGSDYSAFMEKGIEALGLMTSGRGGHPDYARLGRRPGEDGSGHPRLDRASSCCRAC